MHKNWWIFTRSFIWCTSSFLSPSRRPSSSWTYSRMFCLTSPCSPMLRRWSSRLRDLATWFHHWLLSIPMTSLTAITSIPHFSRAWLLSIPGCSKMREYKNFLQTSSQNHDLLFWKGCFSLRFWRWTSSALRIVWSWLGTCPSTLLSTRRLSWFLWVRTTGWWKCLLGVGSAREHWLGSISWVLGSSWTTVSVGFNPFCPSNRGIHFQIRSRFSW